MSTRKKVEVDFDKIDKQVQKAVLADEKYSRENDAKFRAINQKVASYDEFKGIVEASHLKPLDKNDKISSTGSFHQVWNSQAAKTTNDNQEIGVKLTDLKIKNIPKNSSEFWKEWKNIKTLQEKTSFLLKFTDDQLKQYFKLEIPSDQLEILIESLKNIEHVQKLSSILEAIKNSKRFNLAVSFMNSNLKENLKELIKKLENVNSDLTKNMLKLLS